MTPSVPIVGADQLPRTFILWDVDHTLIENGGVSKETYSLAFEQLTGRYPSVRPKTDGRTDFQVMRELFADNLSRSTDQINDLEIEEALAAAIHRVTPGLKDRGYVLPGAREALEHLFDMPNITQSALTGNIERNARVKLSAFDLDHLLDLGIGGYGTDHIVRSRLVQIAREKAFQRRELRFSRSETLIIGDTIRDVQTARDGGAKILAVASGTTNAGALAEAGADKVLPDLADLNRFLSTLAELRLSD